MSSVVVAKAKELIEDGGYDSLKIKSAGISPAWDAAVLRALREAFGPALNLRLDANGGFTPVEALRLGRAIEDLDLEYLEDPVAGIDAMARLRRDLRTPFATNMCIIDFDQLPVGIRAGAADIVLGDIFHWGGVQAFRELAAVCGAFRLGMGMHSFWEMGLATALNLHLAAAHAQVDHAIDGILWLYPDDITAGPRMVVQGRRAAGAGRPRRGGRARRGQGRALPDRGENARRGQRIAVPALHAGGRPVERKGRSESAHAATNRRG